MKKVINFISREILPSPLEQGHLWNKKIIADCLQPDSGRMEFCVQQEIGRAPGIIKADLLRMFNKGERFCSLLFLAVYKSNKQNREKVYRLAAALESLSLGLDVHCGLEENNPGRSSPLLAGDFFFGLALTLASGYPLFITGMAEVITNAVSAGVNGSPGMGKLNCGDWKDYLLRRIAGGQASLAALSCSLGAIGNNPFNTGMELYARFGFCLGMAFYIKRNLLFAEQQLNRIPLQLTMSLPLAQLLENSRLKAELEPLVAGVSCTAVQLEILIKEWNRIKPEVNINRLSRRYYQKAKSIWNRLDEKGGNKMLNRFMESI